MPIVAYRKKGGSNFGEDDEIDGDGNRQCDNGCDALNELTRVR